jgi:outer membrane lipoprotein-sorting protein
MMGRIALILVLASTIGASTKPADRLQEFAFMMGSWTCSYTQGTQTSSYSATMSWALGGNWIRERDTWAGGGDEGLFTYDPSKRQWTSLVMEPDRSPTLFVAGDTGSAHIAYRSVYPDASMTDTIDRISPTKYTVHFTQTLGGKTTHSVDVCTKR